MSNGERNTNVSIEVYQQGWMPGFAAFRDDGSIRTAVNVVTLPVAVVKDVYTLGGIATDQKESYTVQKLEQIKQEAE